MGSSAADDVIADHRSDDESLALVRDFLRDFDRRQTEKVIGLPGGFGVLSWSWWTARSRLVPHLAVFLAVRDHDGQVVARADLYLDPGRSVAQIEDVMTDERYRNRGYAKALLGEATRRARPAGCATRFLLAANDDWPHDLYARLGYEVIGSRHLFARHS